MQLLTTHLAKIILIRLHTYTEAKRTANFSLHTSVKFTMLLFWRTTTNSSIYILMSLNVAFHAALVLNSNRQTSSAEKILCFMLWCQKFVIFVFSRTIWQNVYEVFFWHKTIHFQAGLVILNEGWVSLLPKICVDAILW